MEELLELSAFRSTLELKYAWIYAFGGAGDLQKFMEILPKLEVRSQREYILYVKNHFLELTKDELSKLFVNQHYVKFTLEILTKSFSEVNMNLLYTVLFFWGTLIDKHRLIIVTSSFKELAISVMSKLTELHNTVMLAYFTKKAKLILDSTDLGKELKATMPFKFEKTILSTVKLSYSLNVKSKKVLHYLKAKKFIWLNSQFRLWQLEKLLERYISFFSLQKLSSTELISEIFNAFFGGIYCAISLEEEPYVIFNWRNYIVSRLPALLKSLKLLHSSETLEDSLMTAVSQLNDLMFVKLIVGSSQQPYNLKKVFLRSCIYRDVISLMAFVKLYPEEADTVSSSLITHETEQLNHIEGLTSEFNAKLLNINTEFTLLEESKLIEYMESLPTSNLQFLEIKQNQLHKLVLSLIDTLIREKSNEKLSRLLLALINCSSVANYVFFCDTQGSWSVLNKLIAYIDAESFAVDDDDSNFQDTYAYFGILLTGVIAISSFFGVDFKTVTVKNLYTIEYIHKFFYRPCDDLTSTVEGADDEDNTIVANYNNLLGDWINALFDINNEGLLDDLIKSVNVKQIYKLIFVIFQQAVSARVAGKLTAASLNNGIDYLSQNFLAPCSAEIIRWICTNIGPMHANNEMLIQILVRIIETNLGDSSGDPNYTFRAVLRIVGPEVISRVQSLPNWENTATMARLVKLIRQHIDQAYVYVPQSVRLADSSVSSSETLAASLKAALVHYLREEGDDAALWKTVGGIFSALTVRELMSLLVEEIEACAHGTAEEAKIMVDFLIFLTVVTSKPGYDELYSSWNLLEKELPAHTHVTDSRFTLTMDSHYASIFNEATASYLDPRDDLMTDLEMDDLFNDDDLFGDTGLHPNASSKVYSTSAKVARLCGEAYHAASALAGMACFLAGALVYPVARMKLTQELELWMHNAKL